MASLIADEVGADALICLGYPFHPPGKPDRLRTDHLLALQTPTLIVRGERDPFGRREEVDCYPLSQAIQVLWTEDGDHDLKPRKRSGITQDGVLEAATQNIVDFLHAGVE
jgi:predicted alpha/beta-hydrolase family hydrolase